MYKEGTSSAETSDGDRGGDRTSMSESPVTRVDSNERPPYKQSTDRGPPVPEIEH